LEKSKPELFAFIQNNNEKLFDDTESIRSFTDLIDSRKIIPPKIDPNAQPQRSGKLLDGTY
jgi:hypothetical protein